MSYNIPTLDALSQWVRGLFAAAVDGAVVSIWPNTWYVLGKVLAPISRAFYQRVAWLYAQIFVSSATSQAVINRHGYERGLAPISAIQATGNATFAVVPGVVVPQSLQFQRADGATFSTRFAATATGATISLALSADVAGEAGNCVAGEALTLLYPDDAPQLGTSGTVDTGGIGGGSDAEAKEAFRARILAVKRNPPNGGSIADWQRWAEASAAAINNVWVDSYLTDARRVWICFTRSDRTNGVPTSGDVAALLAALMNCNQRPATARPTVVAPTPSPVAVTLTRVIPNTPAIQAAIAVELQAMFAAQAQAATPNNPFVLPVDWIDEAIGRTPGLTSFTRNAPTGDLTYTTPGAMPTYQAATYV